MWVVASSILACQRATAPSASRRFPAELVAVYDAVQAGDLATAKARWDALYPLMDAIMTAPFIQAVTSALVSLGIPVGPPREPLLPLDDETAARIAALLPTRQRPRRSRARPHPGP